MEIQYCPYRTSVIAQPTQSHITFSPITPLATFTGTKKDAELLEKVRRVNAGEESEPETEPVARESSE